MAIHPSSVIDPSAKISPSALIGPFCVIGPNTVIGDGTRLLSHVVIENATVGKECTVYPQASIGLAPQHLLYKGEQTRVEIGDRNVIRESVTIHRGMPSAGGVTRIGNDCFLMALSHVAHDCQLGNKVIMANGAQLAGHVEIGDSCFISTTVGIHQFVRIGTGAIVSGGAMVSLDVGPFTIAQGDRASLKGLNLVGMKRMGLSRNDIKAVKDAYRDLFFNNLPLKEALEQPTLVFENTYVKSFRDFFLSSKRGFTRPSLEVNVDEQVEA